MRDAPFVLVAIFCPELLLYFAINQYLCARKVFETAVQVGELPGAFGRGTIIG